jgi:uncharacterized protein (DUF362 family)
MSKDAMSRRDFVKRALGFGLAAWGLAEFGPLEPAGGGSAWGAAGEPTIVVASKRGPSALVKAAVDALGGMGKFVKRGQTVLVKPNIGWARKPEQAATTNPEVVAEIVRLCRKAGARQVKVMDHAVDRLDAVMLEMTGIGPAARAAGASVSLASSPAMYQRVAIRRGKVLKSAEVLRDLVRADVFINVPIAKVHGATGLTLGCKNLMGCVWDRGAWHGSASLDQAIADFSSEVRPDLVILDAVRILLTNGPKGPGRTRDPGVVVAGTDPIAVDAYATTLFDRTPGSVAHLVRASELGVGEINLDRIKVKRV